MKATPTRRTYADRYTTEGQRLLCERPESHNAIAAAIGATKQAVSQWRAGRAVPTTQNRKALARHFAVDPLTWDRAPGAAVKASSAPVKPRAAATEALLADAAAAASVDDTASLAELAAALRAARLAPDVTPAALARIGAAELGVRREIERRKTDHEKLLEAPEFLEVRRALVDALDGHPLAQNAAIGALLRFAGDDAGAAEHEAAVRTWRAKHPRLVAAVENAEAALVAASETTP